MLNQKTDLFEDVIPNLSPVWTHMTDIIVDHAEGSWIVDQRGKAWLDFTCGIGVTNTGHCHPKVVEAIRQQAGLLLHGQANIVYHRPMLELVRELKTILPPALDGFFFSNSGAEAVEGAVKLARHATGRPNVIVFQGSFHGRTVGTMTLTTSKTVYKAGYQPLMPGVFVAPYPYAYRYGWSIDETIQFCLEELEGLFTSQTAPWETAAILIEPVLGEGGYVVPPESFMQALRKICDQHGIMLIIDEIQSGFGRTGRWFAHEYQDILPDIMTIAKGLGSGLPISGVISRLDIMKKWIPGSHGGTFGGNAVAAAGAVATVRAIRDENMLQNTLDRSKQLFAGLHNIQADFPVIGDVRGLGLMIGVEFRDNLRRPDKTTCKAVAKKCLENGLMLLTCGPWDNVIRWIPPLVVTASEIDQALDIFHHSMESVRS